MMCLNKGFFAGLACITAAVLFFLCSAPCAAEPVSGISKIEKRRHLMSVFQNEIAEASRHEAEPDAAGDWRGIIESALFMLIRRTEIYRGRMRLILTESEKAQCRIYPDGTITVSTAVLDYIDEKLFTVSQNNTRKMKNFNAERENFIAAVIAFEAARFALDMDVNHLFMKTGRDKLPVSAVFYADEFSSALLKTAGYKPFLNGDFFRELESIKADKNLAHSFSFFFDNFPAPAERLSRINAAAAGAEKLGEELSNILLGLRMQKGISDAKQSITALKENYKDSLYFARLEALAAHSLWFESAFLEEAEAEKSGYFAIPLSKAVFPVIPAAISGSSYEKNYYLKQKIFGRKLKPVSENTEVIAGSKELFLQTLKAYEEYGNIIFEAPAQSAYAVVLAYSANAGDKISAVKIAEEAALKEQGMPSGASRINYASVLFLTMRDLTKAKALLKDMISGGTEENGRFFLTAGKCFDERIPFFNYALMLYALGETELANAAIADFKAKTLSGAASYGTETDVLSLRKLKAGDSVDELIEKWGRPSFIIYNYFSERWLYGNFDAEIIISNNTKHPRTEQINILPNSTITLPGDIRTGDNRKAFEKKYGKPAYFAADCEVYFYGGNVLQVLYSDDIIKSISVLQKF